jgi:hypothetical protein
MVYYNVSFHSTCAISIKLAQGSTVWASGAGTFAPTLAVNTTLLRLTRKTTWHGSAMMTGKVACGTTTVTETGTVWFQ